MWGLGGGGQGGGGGAAGVAVEAGAEEGEKGRAPSALFCSTVDLFCLRSSAQKMCTQENGWEEGVEVGAHVEEHGLSQLGHRTGNSVKHLEICFC